MFFAVFHNPLNPNHFFLFFLQFLFKFIHPVVEDDKNQKSLINLTVGFFSTSSSSSSSNDQQQQQQHFGEFFVFTKKIQKKKSNFQTSSIHSHTHTCTKSNKNSHSFFFQISSKLSPLIKKNYNQYHRE